MDGVDLRDYEIHYLRKMFGVVSQEPVLFNASFRENIKYNLEEVTDEVMRQACLKANSLQFIEGNEPLEEEDKTPAN